MTRQTKWIYDLQNSTEGLTGQDEGSERPDSMNRLILSSFNSYIIIPTAFLKLILWQKSVQPYYILKVIEIVDPLLYLKPFNCI